MLRDKEEMLQQLKEAALLELQSKGDLVRRRRVDDQEDILCKLKQVRNDNSLVKVNDQREYRTAVIEQCTVAIWKTVQFSKFPYHQTHRIQKRTYIA
jgi:hypothetical protein